MRERIALHCYRRFATMMVVLLLGVGSVSIQAQSLAQFLGKVEPSQLIPGADGFGAVERDPIVAPVRKGNELLGYALLNTDYSPAIGYSSKPIHVVVGIDLNGVIRGARLVEHHEPIVLIGIREQRIRDFLDEYIGFDATTGTETEEAVDMVSGATVTSLVMEDSILWAAYQVAHRLGLGPLQAEASAGKKSERAIDTSKPATVKDWQTLVKEGSVASLRLSVEDVNHAFRNLGNPEAIMRPAKGPPEKTFVELYVALVSVPTIGRSLLGENQWNNLHERIALGQQAIIVAGRGDYSFKGSGYVRGGIFDRIELVQDNGKIRFHDYSHTRLASLAAAGAPSLPEISLFTIPKDARFDPARPWKLELLVQRATGALSKVFVRFGLDYTVPEQYLQRALQAVPRAAPDGIDNASRIAPQAGIPATTRGDNLWKRIWHSKTVSIAILAMLLVVLTGIFFFQTWLTRRPRVLKWTRYAVLVFVLVWLGWWSNAQLSVVNIFTLTSSVLSGFSWSSFLMDPLVFILWTAVAVGILFWARGVFCGWLCPFGALQELTNHIGRALGVKQLKIPFAVHERLWAIKYVIFLLLFGLSLYNLTLAERFAEVEPFKTAIILNFVRDWPYVIYALTLLVANLFVERFFCRYLCPLGAALAIPARLRTFDWLKRWPECGTPCQRCSRECPVQAIHPEGHINVNECIYCLHCQELYFDDHRCPHNVEKRLKKERRGALARRGKQPPAGLATAATAGQGPDGITVHKVIWGDPRSSKPKPPTEEN